MQDNAGRWREQVSKCEVWRCEVCLRAVNTLMDYKLSASQSSSMNVGAGPTLAPGERGVAFFLTSLFRELCAEGCMRGRESLEDEGGSADGHESSEGVDTMRCGAVAPASLGLGRGASGRGSRGAATASGRTSSGAGAGRGGGGGFGCQGDALQRRGLSKVGQIEAREERRTTAAQRPCAAASAFLRSSPWQAPTIQLVTEETND